MRTSAAVGLQASGSQQKTNAIAWVEFTVIAALVLALYAAIVVDLGSEWWTEPAASYGMLIPPFALYIAYLRRKITFAITARRELSGLWLTILGCAVLLIGRLAGEFFLARTSFVIVLAGLTWTFWGF